MKSIFKHIKGDKVIWVVVIILSAFSVLAVYSSTSSLAFRFRGGNTEYYMLKQLSLLLFGLVVIFLTHNIKFKYFSRIAQILFVISIPLLAYTLIKGTQINEAARWVTIPVINLTFQSSDFAKLALILYIARAITINRNKLNDFNSLIYTLFLPIFLIIGLIFPANNSTAGILFIICVTMLFFGGIPNRVLFKFIGYTSLGITALVVILMLINPDSTRINILFHRASTFITDSNEEGSQAEQATIAIANGRIFGKFPGNSTQKNILPHPYSDFIYAFIIEEYGLIGGITVLLLYLILLYRGVRIAMKVPGSFSGLSALGITLIIVSQAFINMLVSTGLFPVTGQPLPLISMGGTSILFTCFAIGILLSISRETETEIKKEAIHA